MISFEDCPWLTEHDRPLFNLYVSSLKRNDGSPQYINEMRRLAESLGLTPHGRYRLGIKA